MSEQWWKDDEQLLAALGEALRSERRVPAEVIATGKAAFSGRGTDADPATLTHDSVFDGAKAESAGVASSLVRQVATSGPESTALRSSRSARIR